MTCKECIYENKCISRISHFMDINEATGEAITDIEKRCSSFKNKADFVEVVKVVEILCKIKNNIIKNVSAMIENDFNKIVKDAAEERRDT